MLTAAVPHASPRDSYRQHPLDNLPQEIPMSTRAAYFFKDETDQHMVYKHHDGYPTGATRWLTIARALSWSGARFEADEAAAAFVTAAKLASNLEINDKNDIVFTAGQLNEYKDMRGGGVRLMHIDQAQKDLIANCGQCLDIEYAYIVTMKDGDWHIEAYHTNFPGDVASSKHAKKLWAGPISKMAGWAERREKKAA